MTMFCLIASVAGYLMIQEWRIITWRGSNCICVLPAQRVCVPAYCPAYSQLAKLESRHQNPAEALQYEHI